MRTIKKPHLISPQEYLKTEIESPFKREYVDGRVYARADECNLHNTISCNVLGALGIRLRGGKFKVFSSNAKIRISSESMFRFYYPDSLVVARPFPPQEYFLEKPLLVTEVLSRSTERIDEVEKKDAYLSIPSLSVYLLVSQDQPMVTAYRREQCGFAAEAYEDLEAVIPLPEIGIELPLAEIYEAVEFVSEPDEDEDRER
jgi:Uma2 family endonuclease